MTPPGSQLEGASRGADVWGFWRDGTIKDGESWGCAWLLWDDSGGWFEIGMICASLCEIMIPTDSSSDQYL